MTYIRDGHRYSAEEIKIVIDKLKKLVFSKKKNRISLAVDMAHLEDAKKILDIGSEVGALCGAIADRYPRAEAIYGLECNLDTLEIAKEFLEGGPVKFFHHNCGTLPFDDQSFDRIFALEVLEHIRNIDIFLKEVFRVLQPNGLFVISVPNAMWWRALARNFILRPETYSKTMERWPAYTPDQRDHVNNFDFVHLYRILNLNGFLLEKLCYSDHKHTWLSSLPGLRKLSSTLHISVRKNDSIH